LNKKQIKAVVIMLQVFLVGALFLPAGMLTGASKEDEGALSVFGMINRYAGMGFSDDALFYMVMTCVFPVAVILSILFLKERKNFGTAIVLSALYSAASACFFSAAKRKMVDYATLTTMPYLIVFLALTSMMLLILGFFYAVPPEPDGKNKKE
jgi:hypothetical protein